MRIRKAVISVALSAAAIGGMAAAPALASAATTTPFVGRDVGGGLLTRHSLSAGQVINLVGTNGSRIANYRVTAAHRNGEAFYITVRPRLQGSNGDLVHFTISN